MHGQQIIKNRHISSQLVNSFHKTRNMNIFPQMTHSTSAKSLFFLFTAHSRIILDAICIPTPRTLRILSVLVAEKSSALNSSSFLLLFYI